MDKQIKDYQVEQLIIEALDYNSNIVALCTGWFGKTDTRRSSDRFVKEYQKMAKLTMERRKEILGIEEELS
jgi:hypothetical protein